MKALTHSTRVMVNIIWIIWSMGNVGIPDTASRRLKAVFKNT